MGYYADDWILDGNIIQQYKQIGNAVPIGVGKAIGQLILNDMKNIPNKEYKGFKYSRYTNTNDITWKKDYLKRSKIELN